MSKSNIIFYNTYQTSLSFLTFGPSCFDFISVVLTLEQKPFITVYSMSSFESYVSVKSSKEIPIILASFYKSKMGLYL